MNLDAIEVMNETNRQWAERYSLEVQRSAQLSLINQKLEQRIAELETQLREQQGASAWTAPASDE